MELSAEVTCETDWAASCGTAVSARDAIATLESTDTVPSGGAVGSITVFLGLSCQDFLWFSKSAFEISASICALNSFDARRKSLRIFPTWRPISGNFLGPKINNATKNRKIVSEKLIDASYCRITADGNASGQLVNSA